MATSTAVPTIGEIARRLHQPVHRIEYVIRSRGIDPTGRAGHVRIFTDADVQRVANELERIDNEKNRRDKRPRQLSDLIGEPNGSAEEKRPAHPCQGDDRPTIKIDSTVYTKNQ